MPWADYTTAIVVTALVVVIVAGVATLVLRDLIFAYLDWRHRKQFPIVPVHSLLQVFGAGLRACFSARTGGFSAIDGGHLPLLLVAWLAGFIFVSALATSPRSSSEGTLFTVLISLLVALVAALAITFLLGRIWRPLWLLVCAVLLWQGAPAACAALLLMVVVSKVWQYDGAARLLQHANMMRELAEAMRLGLPLDAVLEALARERRGAFAAQMGMAAAKLRTGEGLSTALDQPGFLPRYAIAAIRAAEQGGGREAAAVAQAVAEDLQRGAHARSIVGSAMLYPFTVWAACVPFALFLASTVLRGSVDAMRTVKYPAVVRQAARQAAVVVALPWAIGAVVLAAFLFVYLQRWVQNSAWADNLWEAIALRAADLVPLLRGRQRHQCLARCARNLAALLRGGTSFHEACRVVSAPALAGPWSAALDKLGRAVEMGRPLKEALGESGLPRSFRALAQVGAVGGELETALSVAAEWHEARVQTRDSALGVMLTCVSLPLIGLMIGSIAYIHFSMWAALQEYYASYARHLWPWT